MNCHIVFQRADVRRKRLAQPVTNRLNEFSHSLAHYRGREPC
jgi:hypothetical protein